jgi:hypothetical protein
LLSDIDVVATDMEGNVMSIADAYTNEIRAQLRKFATWEPGEPRELGDYGELRGSLFLRNGNIADPPFNVSFETNADPTSSPVTYSSSGAVSIEADGGVSGPLSTLAKLTLGVTINFKKENAIFFHVLGARYDSIRNQLEVERQLLDAYAAGNWKDHYVVITERVGAKSSTVIVSSAMSASVQLSAAGGDPFDMADANVKLVSSGKKDIGYETITDEDATPLLSLSRIQLRGQFWNRRRELVRELGFSSDADLAKTSDALIEDLQRSVDPEVLRDAVLAEGADLSDGFELGAIKP